MATTQAQLAALHTNLVELMGQESADSLMNELPPGGWDQIATKEALAATEQRLQTRASESMAEINGRFAETNARITEMNAELRSAMEAGFAELRSAILTGLAEAAKERAEIIKAQARQLYVIVATISAATISIWIALFTGASGA